VTGTTGRSRAALAAGVTLGLLLLVLAAASGPVGFLHESGRRLDPPPPQPASTGSDEPTQQTLHEVTRGQKQLIDLSWLGTLFATAMLLVVVLVVLALLRHLWVQRWRPPERPAQVDFELAPDDRLAASLQAAATALQDTLDHGRPADAIVSCWRRLQQEATDAGLPPDPAETSTEYVVRALHRLDLDPRATAGLAALYREARFSEHPLGEDARAAARASLSVLQADLARRTADA